MASKDFRKREKKKPKKDILKKAPATTTSFQPTFSVEVIKKGKKKVEGEEPEE